jgi:seryl-tRNA synthetase
MKQKDELTAQKKSLEESANEKHVSLLKTAKRVGNYVHESVPVSDNEVRLRYQRSSMSTHNLARTTTQSSVHMKLMARSPRRRTVFHTTKFLHDSMVMTLLVVSRSSATEVIV